MGPGGGSPARPRPRSGGTCSPGCSARLRRAGPGPPMLTPTSASPGRVDGRASDGRIVGGPDAPAVIRAAGDGFRGVWIAGQRRSSRPALGPSPLRERDQADPERQRTGAWARPAPSIAPYPTGPSSPRYTCGERRERPSCLKPATFRALHNPPPGRELRGRLDRASNAPGPAVAL